MENKNKKDKKYKVSDILRFIWTYVRKYSRPFYILLAVTLFISLGESISPYLYGRMIDSFLGKQIIFNLSLPGLLLLWSVLVIIMVFARRVTTRLIVWIEVMIEKDFANDIVSRILYLPVKYFYDQKPGESFKKIDRATSSITMIFDSLLFNFAGNILNIIVSLLIMFKLDWRLSLINMVAIIVFLIFATTFRMKKILVIRKEVNARYNKLFGNIGDFLANIFTVKTNTTEKYEIKRVEKEYKSVIAATNQSMKLWTQVSLGQGLISWTGILLTVILGAYFLEQNIISVGDFVSFLLYTEIIYRPLWSLTNQYRQMKRMIVDIGDAREMLKEAPEESGQAQEDIKDLKGELEFKNVSFKYPERNQGILQNVSFKVPGGQTLAIFGETGSGKTTAYNLLLRLYETDSGQIFYDGIDSRKVARQSLRSQIAVVPQDPSLFNESILDNIKYGKQNATMQEVISAAKIANAHVFISALPNGYKTKVGERGVKLSGGQVQRIAIARAALRNPKILILDEATTSLDQKTKFAVLDALQHLIKDRTTIIITHDFSAITQSADQIIVLDKGKIVQRGKHHKLVSQAGIYRDLWQTQQKHLQEKK
ncbi:MAG: ABC transporter ATP-binding protein [Candidatus Parcubacteria bacterium]|nr:ABC transporter ATP-binding protein [Candidatus Parcubacteria bacterium]